MVDTQQKTFITETNEVCRTTEHLGGETKRRRRKVKNPIPYSMRENPELNHPSLTRGQKKFLGSICTVYSTENMKRGIEEQYVRQLLYEKDKGIIKGADWFKYLDYFCQSSKRKHLFRPSTLASRSVKSRKLRTGADIHRPILAPLPPIPRAVSQNIRSSKRSSLSNSHNPATPRYVTTIRRNESIPDVSFSNDPVEANITVIGDDDDKSSHKSPQTLSTVSTSKESSEITETTLTFPSEVSKDAREEDTTRDPSVGEDSVSQTAHKNEPESDASAIATIDKKAEKISSESSEKKIKEKENAEDKPSADNVKSSGETLIEVNETKSEEEITTTNEKDKDDAEDEQNVGIRKNSVSSSNEPSTNGNDRQAEKAVSSEKESSYSEVAGSSPSVEEKEDVPLGEPTTNLLTLLGQPDEEVQPLQGEGITRPKSRIGNRPTRSPV